MNKRRWIKWGVIVVPVILIVVFALSFVPHKVVNVEPTNVSKITIFNGNSGDIVEITDKSHIHHIISNLNAVTFQKGKPSFGYLGFSFRTTIFNKEGKEIKELIINSSDTIRYNGFFYKSEDYAIDYDFIESLMN
ncbi:hypothetical protein ACFYKX_09270 [Cytobacillus sp. FJAT-54145]|uniref:DUF3139 domain-containing protein n=1 Tax=Cytobacillus spartinae TaxID=3299023 RepID=A0ABW6KD26_9BACI